MPAVGPQLLTGSGHSLPAIFLVSHEAARCYLSVLLLSPRRLGTWSLLPEDNADSVPLIGRKDASDDLPLYLEFGEPGGDLLLVTQAELCRLDRCPPWGVATDGDPVKLIWAEHPGAQ
jgi:hypothetical protein